MLRNTINRLGFWLISISTPKDTRVDIPGLFSKISALMGVTRHELTGKARPRRISDARAIFSYICRKKGLSHKRIGIILNKDHSSIISAERRVMVLMKYDPNIRKIIESFNV